MIDLKEAERIAQAGTAEFMQYARKHWQDIITELSDLRSEVETLRLGTSSFGFIPTFRGRVVHSEIDPESGLTVGRVSCPECQEEMAIGVMGNTPMCRCGLEWSLDTEAVGTPKLER